MARVTLQLIEGLERGSVYHDLPTPVTIGREDDNAVRLNDERVSRFHAKIQEDAGRIILTDLDSTNGTRVNGHPVQMRVLQPGDHLSIGRCLLVYGSRQQISERMRHLLQGENRTSQATDRTVWASEDGPAEDSSGLVLAPDPASQPLVEHLFPDGPPSPPPGLRAFQKAEISDMLAYCHEQIRIVLQAAVEDSEGPNAPGGAMRVSQLDWQRLLKLEMELAVYMRRISDPDA